MSGALAPPRLGTESGRLVSSWGQPEGVAPPSSPPARQPVAPARRPPIRRLRGRGETPRRRPMRHRHAESLRGPAPASCGAAHPAQGRGGPGGAPSQSRRVVASWAPHAHPGVPPAAVLPHRYPGQARRAGVSPRRASPTRTALRAGPCGVRIRRGAPFARLGAGPGGRCAPIRAGL